MTGTLNRASKSVILDVTEKNKINNINAMPTFKSDLNHIGMEPRMERYKTTKNNNLFFTN